MFSYPRRLIEVDLPIKRISAHARREKSIRHGHISTLHIWWARRPLAACRAVICAALWPDPADEHCPQSFRDAARREMQKWTTHERQALLSEESRPHFEKLRRNPDYSVNPVHLRTLLLDFIADFANWDNSTVREYLDTSRALTQAAHEALGGAPGTRPLVVDPFCGGGQLTRAGHLEKDAKVVPIGFVYKFHDTSSFALRTSRGILSPEVLGYQEQLGETSKRRHRYGRLGRAAKRRAVASACRVL